MAIQSLPLELVRSIVEQDCLTRKDLRSLALSSSLLRDEAQRMLFKDPGHVRLGNERFSQDKFLDTIIASPKRLAPMVRVYSQVIDWEEFRYTARKSMTAVPRREREERQKLILGKIQRALELMVNLKHLAHDELRRSSPLVNTMTSVLTKKCTFRLKTLVWTYDAKDGIQEELNLFHHFLPRQSSLRSLCFNRIRVPQKLPRPKADFYDIAKSVCPQLEYLSAPSDFIISVLPMRPEIKRLSWLTSHDADGGKDKIDSTTIACLTDPLKNLQILDYHCANHWRRHGTSELLLISSHLKNLVILSVDSLRDVTPTILSNLPHLCIIAITLEASSRSPDDLDVIKSALLRSPSLTCVDISNIRGGRAPFYVKYSECWYWRYSLDSANALIAKTLPIQEHFDWDMRYSFRNIGCLY